MKFPKYITFRQFKSELRHNLVCSLKEWDFKELIESII